MIRIVFGLLVALAVIPAALIAMAQTALDQGRWRWSRALGRVMPYLLGRRHGRSLAFLCEVIATREIGTLDEAAALARACVADAGVAAQSRNAAIDVLISAGEYAAALGAEPPPQPGATGAEAHGLALIQVNLAEAEYNLGRWDAAEARLARAEEACLRFAMSRAGLYLQRAWIAACRGRARDALAFSHLVERSGLPRIYHAEYYFTRAAALLAAGEIEAARATIEDADSVVVRRSSRRNALFLRARVATARGDWSRAEQLCREAANHSFRGQGGDGLLLWARALRNLGRDRDAEEALRLVIARDPESEAAVEAAAAIHSVRNEWRTPGSTA
jgi:tetratricopeptide (TPR) repeat protein